MTVLMLAKMKLSIRIFSCKKLYQFRTEFQADKLHSSVHLKLLKCFMYRAVNSKYLSANVPGLSNVHKLL